MASKKINVTELDFDNIKSNLKAFLRTQSTFQDYDFEGSGLSVLLDILAYNTHYNALYNNLAINESFLDSARKRNSVVSLANNLGYTPQSAKCATATVNISAPGVSVIPSNLPFNTAINGVNYTFYPSDTYVQDTGTNGVFTGIKLIEKSNSLTYSYTIQSNVTYTIPNPNVDLTLLTVLVDSVPYNNASNIVNIDSTSKVYWIKEIDDGLYQISFGNGIIGYQPSNGSALVINYVVSSLDAPNGAKLFTVSGYSGYTVTTVSSASGGSAAEDIESIRFNAPRAYSAQNRAVTINDYKSIIMSAFQEAKSVSAWGGEDNIPPIYGKVFICIKPKTTDILTLSQKSDILTNILPSKNLMTVVPEILDPEYINIVVKSTVYYNELLTSRTADTIKSIVIDTINNYNATELEQFDGIFRYSKLSKLIDNSESSIINNITTVTLKRNVIPRYNIIANYTINLVNPIYYSGSAEDIVLTSGFYIPGYSTPCYLVDDGLGSIMLFSADSNGIRTIINPTIGTVDYQNGIISVSNLNISSLVGDYFTFYIKPSSNDVASIMTQIAQISMDDLIVNVISDKSSTGDLRGGQNYTFATSRI